MKPGHFGFTGDARCFACLLLCMAAPVAWLTPPESPAAEPAWKTVKEKHFIVYHTGQDSAAEVVAEEAERCYDGIAADLGYRRFDHYWLWDRRASIRIYSNAQAFAEACNAPAWAAGKANYERREIATYAGSGAGFSTRVLPHEVAHLILAEFVGGRRLPVWLQEGVAQWEQERKTVPAKRLPDPMPLAELMVADVREKSDPRFVIRFYAQAASVVGYLISVHGSERFGSFCRSLRRGKTVEESFAEAYTGDLKTWDDLEKAWMRWEGATEP